MKKTILFLITITTSIFANYNFNGNNMGKIDMHGGKKQNIVPNNIQMNSNFKGLNNFSINKPQKPLKPKVKEIIKKEKKKDKNINE